jgi:beta-lactamase regulating signal transducer with metallopeptidase domain
MLTWMVYGLLVSALLCMPAIALDALFRVAGLPRRFIWLTALLGVVALSLSPLRERMEVGLPASTTSTVEVTYSEAVVPADATLSDRLERGVAVLRSAAEWPLQAVSAAAPVGTGSGLLIAWAVASLALLLLGLLTFRRYGRERGSWPRREIEGVSVRVAPSAGPAVIGVLRAEIVVPQWLLTASAEEQRMVLLHEREHLRTYDPLVLTFAALAAVIVPWNPVAWWMLHRLRVAVEMDCDARVLAEGVDCGRYGTFLIDMAGRGAGLPLSVAALAASSTTLERRLTAMVKATGSYMFARTAALALLGSVALITACEMRMPTATEVADMDVAAVEHLRWEVVGATSSNITYEVDGVVVTAEEARALAPTAIATVDVSKEAGTGEARIRIRTSAAGEADGAERVMLIRSGGDGEARADSTARVLIRHSSGGEGQRAGVRMITPGATGAEAAILYIDGVRVDPARMRTLRPEQIEKIEVIKGEAAVARFGDADAANGVIRITTKSAAAPGS